MGLESPRRGVESPISAHVRTPRRQQQQPSTPTVIPPTPSPATTAASMAGPSSSSVAPATPSPASSSQDLFADSAERDRDADARQTNRRSLYRSPGTSSSPDLATLVRRARDRGGAVGGGGHKKESKRLGSSQGVHSAVNGQPNRSEPPQVPPPDRPTTTTRPRSSTSTSTFSRGPDGRMSPLLGGPVKGKHRAPMLDLSSGSGSIEQGMPTSISERMFSSISSRSSPEKGLGFKQPKSSVRAKTSAFLGKMLGSGSTRERSRADGSGPSAPTTPATPSFSNPFSFLTDSPPVPPIPANFQHLTPSRGKVDVNVTLPRSPDVSKPLPPIVGSPTSGTDPDDHSLVIIEPSQQVHPPRSASPFLLVQEKSTDTAKPSTPTHNKKRSMSVSEIEFKSNGAPVGLPLSRPPTATPLTTPKKGSASGLDDTLNGILIDFKGELSQLDPSMGASLDLKDPSTPARRAALSSRSATTDWLLSPGRSQDEAQRPPVHKATTAPSSFLAPPSPRTSNAGEGDAPPSPTAASPIIPPRSSSLHSRSPNLGSGSPRVSQRRGPGAVKVRAGLGTPPTQFQMPIRGLRAQHRTVASSSEPSLIPDDGGLSDNSPSKTISRRLSYVGTSTSSTGHAAQHELTVGDLARPSSSSSPSKGDEGDIESRGKELAKRCWSEDEDFLAKEKIAEWLGGIGRINKIALRHYLNFFDFSSLRLDMAFRRLCTKLFLKAETQQVDRILEEFSRRYWDCNPNSVYGSASVVHAVSYSLLLLNTDLHVAELATHMSRGQFVRNTLSAIQMQLEPSAQVSTSDLTYDDCSSSLKGSDTDTIARTKRSNSITSWNSVSKEAVAAATSPGMTMTSTPQLGSVGLHSNGSTPSVQVSLANAPKSTEGGAYGRHWETEMEALLKEMYNAIKAQQILQPVSGRLSVSSLSPGPHVMRNRSLRTGQQDRLATLKRGSIRGLQSIIAAQSAASPYSSNSSIDGRISPSPSFATSTNDSGMHGSSSSFLTPALGFASNLSHTIIREAQEDDDRSLHSTESGSTTISITDEELALLGAPWAKEGMLCRKQYFETSGKRARDKSWLDLFVVIQKGELSMFVFGEHGGGGNGVVGGGNWLANASAVGTIQLAHSMAHILPPPGYNKQRPHCMVLTLATGALYFFQAGTEELVNEWVSTCNYWAARTSKEPLSGGVSNMEYGWNRLEESSLTPGRSTSEQEGQLDYSDAMSVRSGRSSRSKFGWRDGAATMRSPHSPWVDRIFINDWKPPMPPTIASLHDEETQLEALTKHVTSMKIELQKHNEYREAMSALYTPRSANFIKALSNWEKKSKYLLEEIVKYELYIDALHSAMSLRLKKRGERALERALNGVTPDDDDDEKGKWKGPEDDPIPEDEEPPTPSATATQFHGHEIAGSSDPET